MSQSNSSNFVLLLFFIGAMLAMGVFFVYFDVQNPIDILFALLAKIAFYMTVAIVCLAFVALFSWAMIIVFKDFSSCIETELNIDLKELMSEYKAMFASDWESFTKKVKGEDDDTDNH